MVPFSPKRPDVILDEWMVEHWNRLFACAEKCADAGTDVGLLLTSTLRKVARVFEKRPMNGEEMLAYTLCSIRNAAREARRRNRNRCDAEDGFGQQEALHRPQAESPAGQAVQQDRHAALQHAIRQLPPDEATLLHLRMWDDLPFATIAQKLGVSESTARRRYDAALEQVKRNMGGAPL